MRIVEILLPRGVTDKSLSPQVVKQIDTLQKRMSTYVDKIMDPKTSPAGKEFLKARLRDDYLDMKNSMSQFRAVAESELPDSSKIEFEVIDSKTGLAVAGPYKGRIRANRAVDKLDNIYGGYRYKARPINSLSEAVHKLPLSDNDFEAVKKMMEKPIPAVIAPIYISEFIVDDEFTDLLLELENKDPNMDVRSQIEAWFSRVMPDQMHRFRDDLPNASQRKGALSVIHGYDTHEYKGTNDPLTGNSYGHF